MIQLQKIAFSGILCCLFLFSSCQKEEVNDETWYSYDETKCADAWHQYPILPTFKGLIVYHFSEFTDIPNITVDDIDIDENGGEEQSCEACSCTTGTMIRVRADLEFQAAMEAEGFILE